MTRGIFDFFRSLFSRDRESGLDALIAKAHAKSDDDRTRLRIADAYLAAGDDDEALLWYWDAARINLKAERYPRAVALLIRVLSIDLENIRALVELARCHEELGHLTDAARCYTVAAQLRARDGYADEAYGLRRRVAQLTQQGEQARASSLLEPSLEETVPYSPGEVGQLLIQAAKTVTNLHEAGLVCRFPFEAVPQA